MEQLFTNKEKQKIYLKAIQLLPKKHFACFSIVEAILKLYEDKFDEDLNIEDHFPEFFMFKDCDNYAWLSGEYEDENGATRHEFESGTPEGNAFREIVLLLCYQICQD